MSPAVVMLVILAGLSESAGRVLPIVARRSHVSPQLVSGLMVTGTVVEATVIALWPPTAARVAELVGAPSSVTLDWTPATVAPLLLCAVLALPLVGPFLHAALLVAVGAVLAGRLATASGLDWWLSAACVAAAGLGLAVVVEGVRFLMARLVAAGARRAAA